VSKTKRLLAGLGLAVAMIGGATGLTAVREGARAPHEVQPLQATQAVRTVEYSSADDPEGLSRAFREAARRSLPGVVHVQVEQRAQRPGRFRNSEPPVRQGSGSGFTIRPDGYIITNNHVIDGAERVTVVLQDRREFTAEIVGRDPNTDIAVIRIDARDLPVMPLGDSDVLEVGDWVVALGYPLSLGNSATATAGIISAKGRNLAILGQNSEAGAPLENFLQTDAAINPGNSGGPLVDLQGRAVGVNSAIASPTGLFSGYGFAVPINLVRRVADDLIRFGELHRPQLGVSIDDVDPVDAEVYKLPSISGAEITRVTPGFAAEKAGIRIGDVVVSVDDRDVASSGQLMELLALHEPGERVTFALIRYGTKIRVPVDLGQFPPSARAEDNRRPAPRTGIARLGFAAAGLTPELAEQLALGGAQGVVITGVDPTSGAVRARLNTGMLIDRVNGQPVRSLEDLERLTSALRPGDAVSMVVRSRDRETGQLLPTIANFRVRS
jgi:serine protease Do